MKLRDKVIRYENAGFTLKSIKFARQSLWYGKQLETDYLINDLLDTFDYDANVDLYLCQNDGYGNRCHYDKQLLPIDELEELEEEDY